MLHQGSNLSGVAVAPYQGKSLAAKDFQWSVMLDRYLVGQHT